MFANLLVCVTLANSNSVKKCKETLTVIRVHFKQIVIVMYFASLYPHVAAAFCISLALNMSVTEGEVAFSKLSHTELELKVLRCKEYHNF
jgi:hypothetical protein